MLKLEQAPIEQDITEQIALAADGDLQAREWLAREWTPRLFQFAWRMLGDEQDAREVAQDAMLRCLGSLDRYDPNRKFSTWAYGIARNAAIDRHRRRTVRAAAPLVVDAIDPNPTPAMATVADERARIVREALASLPPNYRDVLVLYHFEQLRYTEIAQTLDLPLGTVMNRIFRARRLLRDKLGPLS